MWFRLAQKLVNKEQSELIKKELMKAKSSTGNILRNQLDALRNKHFAQQNFETQMQDAVALNEDVQKRHGEILQEYLQTKLQYQYALKKSESAKKMGSALLDHYRKMHEMNGKRFEKEKQIRSALDKLEPLAKVPEEKRLGRESSISSESSLNVGELGKQPRDIKVITDKLFQLSLEENGLEQELIEDDEYGKDNNS